MAGPDYDLTVNFDNGIESIYFSYGSTSYTFSTSGELYLFSFEPGNDINLTVTLKSSYSLDNSTLGTISGNTIVIPENEISSSMDCTITSKPSTPRKSVDLTTLAGWSSLSSGTHNITIVAKADGFKDSAPSAAVQVEKAAAETAVGTWLFKNKVGFSPYSGSGDKVFAVKMTVTDTNGNTYQMLYIRLNYGSVGFVDIYGTNGRPYIAYYSNSANGFSGLNTYCSLTLEDESHSKIDKTTERGIALRTVTITGGSDATNSDFITWLKANAEKQS